MAFQRIAQTEIDAADNLGRDDTPNAGTAGMQQILDAYPNLIAKKFNLLVDSLDTEISSRYTKAETDAKIGAKVVEIGAGDMAKAVYDTNGDGVVNDSDNGIFVYTHTKSGKVHNFVFGRGLSSPANGKALMTAALSAGDTVQINGVAYPAFAGVDSVEELPDGRWVTFVFDGAQVNFKSGGAALNFKVVGGTAAPMNPQENTLWVNTDKPIAGWSFLTTQYTGTSPDGWIQIICGVTSNVSFNALKKNELLVYPIQCIQYVNGAWILKAFKVFRNNSWIDIGSFHVLKAGSKIDATGGFNLQNAGAGTSSGGTLQSDGSYEVMCANNSQWHQVWATSKNSFDVTDYSKIRFKLYAAGNYAMAPFYVGIVNLSAVTSALASYTFLSQANTIPGKYYDCIIDISKIAGEKNISVSIGDNYGGGGQRIFLVEVEFIC